MSRIGRLPITVPSGVDVAIDGRTVTVKGPKGTLTPRRRRAHPVGRTRTAGIEVTRPDDERESRSRHGLTRSSRQHGHRV